MTSSARGRMPSRAASCSARSRSSSRSTEPDRDAKSVARTAPPRPISDSVATADATDRSRSARTVRRNRSHRCSVLRANTTRRRSSNSRKRSRIRRRRGRRVAAAAGDVAAVAVPIALRGRTGRSRRRLRRNNSHRSNHDPIDPKATAAVVASAFVAGDAAVAVVVERAVADRNHRAKIRSSARVRAAPFQRPAACGG